MCRFPPPAGFASKRPKNEGNGHLIRREGRRKAQKNMKTPFLMPPVVSYPRLQPFRTSGLSLERSGGPAPRASSLLAPWPSFRSTSCFASEAHELPALVPQKGAPGGCSETHFRLGSDVALEVFPGYWCSLKQFCLLWRDKLTFVPSCAASTNCLHLDAKYCEVGLHTLLPRPTC